MFGSALSRRPFLGDLLKEILKEKIEVVDFKAAKMDVEHLVRDRASLALWSRDFFKVICERMRMV